MLVYRISKLQYVAEALLGIGTARSPGRWNSRGTALAYVATSAPLAILEVLVHVDKATVPVGSRLLTYEVPDDAVTILPKASYPPGWNSVPYSAAVRAVGDAFVQANENLAMLVPSAVSVDASNLLINPAHARFAEIKLLSNRELVLDERLFATAD